MQGSETARVIAFDRKGDSYFWGRHSDYDITIKREDPEHPSGFYIMVMSPMGAYAYDGWWGDHSNTLDEAVLEAIKGSQLVSPDKTKVVYEARSARPGL